MVQPDLNLTHPQLCALSDLVLWLFHLSHLSQGRFNASDKITLTLNSDVIGPHTVPYSV